MAGNTGQGQGGKAGGKSGNQKGGKGGANGRPNIIIRKEEVVEGGHHGGAWKVAYADFVTAMMAFFLLMWLINATTEAQRIGLADYFSQANVLNRGASGEGKPFGGHTPFDKGALASDRGAVRVIPGPSPVPAEAARLPESQTLPHPAKPATPPKPSPPLLPPAAAGSAPKKLAPAGPSLEGSSPKALLAAAAALETHQFDQAAHQVRAAIQADPLLAALGKQIAVDETPLGLRIQIMDAHGQPMFALGSAAPNQATQILLRKIAPILIKLNHNISISGYTDAAPYASAGRSNWDLSVERANATRQLLLDAGLAEARISEVTGYADRHLLLPTTPLAAGNRRVAIMVLRDPAGAVPAP